MVGRPLRGGETPLWWGDPAVAGRPRSGGETPLWWGDHVLVGGGVAFLPFTEKDDEASVGPS